MNIEKAHMDFCTYQLTMRNFTQTTIDSYREALRLFLTMLPHAQEIEHVSEKDVRQFFYDGRVKRNWKASTFVTYHKRLNVFFKWAVKNNIIQENPFEQIEKPRLEKRLPTRLTKQESFLLLEIAGNLPSQNKYLQRRNHAIIATFLYCGLRKSELIKLKCSDVDTENRLLCIKQAKGNKDRLVPIPNPLVTILDRYWAERVKTGKMCPEYFASSPRDCGFTNEGLKRLVSTLRDVTGIYFYIHMLRHTFATLMLEGGCDIYSLSKLMGHNDIKTTTIYLSASVEHLRSEMTKHPLNRYQ